MKLVVQRVAEASVTVAGDVIGKIGPGLVILLCIEKGDTGETVAKYAAKIAEMRIFGDDQGKMNRSILETGGETLLISQFTLAADLEKGRRPGFDRAAPPDVARDLYESFANKLQEAGVPVITGIFQAMMKVALINDGPVTFILG